MKFTGRFLICIASLVGFAAFSAEGGKLPSPKIACHGNFAENKDTIQVAGGEFSTKNPLKFEAGGYKGVVELTRIVAVDGGPATDSFDYTITVSKDDQAAYATSTISAKDTSARLYVLLRNGKEKAYLNCHAVK